VFEHSNRLLARDPRKVLNELGERMTALQVVEQGLYGNAGTAKDRDTAEDFGIDMDLGTLLGH